jgi:hypothetical protein
MSTQLVDFLFPDVDVEYGLENPELLVPEELFVVEVSTIADDVVFQKRLDLSFDAVFDLHAVPPEFYLPMQTYKIIFY